MIPFLDLNNEFVVLGSSIPISDKLLFRDVLCIDILFFPDSTLRFMGFLLTNNATANSIIVATTKNKDTSRYTPSLSMLCPAGESF